MIIIVLIWLCTILQLLRQKKWQFSDDKSDVLLISTQNIYHLGGSNEHPHTLIQSRYKNNNV